jgi:tetratricopeptide (TPR) repeat protein
MIAAALEILERGWPAAEASALLRAVPEEFFLPQDRVRWLLLDPRGSVEAVVRKLLERGDLQGAARAARAGSAKQQPAELLPLLARVELEAGYSGVALETLSALAVEGQPFRSCTAVALRAALQQALASMPPHALAATVERVLASGPAEDPGLPSAIDSLLATGHMAEAEALLAWLAPQSPPFLAELLLRQAAARLIAGAARLQDDDLERAAALLEDGRPDLGRMLLAFERDEAPPLAREARAALSTPLSEAPGRRAALLFLAGEPERAAELVARAALDGRDFLLELVAGCLGTGARAAREELPGLSGFLQESVPPGSALLLALASEIPPFSAWSLERTAELPLGTRQDPWMRVLRAQAWLALGLHEQGLAELSSAGEEPDDARGAWVRARLLRARGAAPEERLQAELDWLVASGRAQNAAADAELELALLRSALAARAGAREEAVRVLEAALEAHPQDRTLLGRLAELEDTPGRRTRALELQTQLIDALPARDAAPEVLAFLDVLRVARREDEISEARWWSEVEALEAARPMDPAPVRELAARAFERAGPPDGPGRADALGRLTRFRSRTLERPLEGLRVGETERWTRLLARHAPERAVAFAEAELRLDPADPALWRASAEALLAAGRTPAAIERLEALQRVAPDLPSARTLALTRFRLTNDAQQLGVDLTRLRSLHPEAEADPVLRFYSALAGTGAKRFLTSVEEVMRLWSERGANGLSGDSEHGRRLALWLYKHGSKAHALGVLTDVLELAQGALERDVLTALARLMEAAPAAERGRARAERPAAPRPDDAPAANGGAAREHADAATRSRAKGPAKPGASRAGDAKTPPAKKRADKPATPARRPQK